MTAPPEDPALEALLAYLRDSRGFDFTGYKRSSLGRRVTKRMSQVDITSYGDYQDYLEVHPEEFARLFDTILINVTGFFRDPEHWDYVAREVLPALHAAHRDDPIRIWSAGCASGEEAYTIAMLVAEADTTDSELRDRVKIYATDIDDDALITARHATYSAETVEAIPQALRDKYLEPSGSRFMVRPDLRRAVIFGRHDVVADAPISRLDLLVCRNVLMYFNAETQTRILDRLHFALKDDGYLFLGKAEMLLTRTNVFEPVDLKHRVFRKSVATVDRDRPPPPGSAVAANHVSRQIRLRDAAFAASPAAQIVVDRESRLVLANNRARATFGLGPHDIGRPIHELELSYRPVELRGPIDRLVRDRQPAELHGIERLDTRGQRQYFEVYITPLVDTDGQLTGVGIVYEDVTRSEDLRARLQQSNQDLETAYEELQSTNEELETTNEELQSSNEELETTNEELQSANEELETMNEELQSANNEQEAFNRELTTRSEELDRANSYLESILASVDVGVVVVDQDFVVQVWNDRAFDLWGLRADEVNGRSLLGLELGLPVSELASPVRSVLAGEPRTTVSLGATNRRGFSITCRVSITALTGPDADRQGAVLLMEEHAE